MFAEVGEAEQETPNPGGAFTATEQLVEEWLPSLSATDTWTSWLDAEYPPGLEQESVVEVQLVQE